MQSSPSSWRSALRAAFPHTVPILAGFLVLGATYGMLMQAIGYGPLWSGLFSAIAFGGSTQYAAVPLLAAGFDPLEVFLLSLTISARHLFYSVSMLKKYDDLGWKRWILYYLSVSLLDWRYWVTASMLGGVLGGVLPFDISGMDFALTALFVVLFLEQLRQKQRRLPGTIGIACAVVALLVCGPDNLVTPSMVLIFASLLIGRKKLCA